MFTGSPPPEGLSDGVSLAKDGRRQNGRHNRGAEHTFSVARQKQVMLQ